MQISNDLKSEHQLILKYIELMERYIEFGLKNNGTQLFWDKAETFIHFIQNFADKFHHAKEEDILFRHMALPGVLTHCNPLPQMLMEHDLGRGCVQGMKEALNSSDLGKLVKSAREYGALLKEHIFKEDHILFPMAEEGIPELDKQSLVEEYDNVETKLGARVLWEEYENQLAELECCLNDAVAKENVLV